MLLLGVHIFENNIQVYSPIVPGVDTYLTYYIISYFLTNIYKNIFLI